MTTTHTFLSRLAYVLCFFCFMGNATAQEDPAFSQQGVSLIGVKQVSDGLLFVEKGEEKNQIIVNKLNTDAVKLWSTRVTLPKLRGYKFNKLHLLQNDVSVYVVSEFTETSQITELDLSTGMVKQQNTEVNNNTKRKIGWLTSDSLLHAASTEEGKATIAHFKNEELSDFDEAFEVQEHINPQFHQVISQTENAVIYGSYKINRNHGEINLAFDKYDVNTKDTIHVEQDLTLDYTSYTYNSSVDKTVFGTFTTPTGFYLVGKLDMAFKKDYPTTKLGDNFIGFWVAKFDNNCELQYFSELPFQYFDGIIPADMIAKPAIIDIKEDDNGGLFIALNEIPGIIYGQKYLFYVDDHGIYVHGIGGEDTYNFYEYDIAGLRNSGRSSKVRLMNDDWSSYPTKSFAEITKQPVFYSTVANNVIAMAHNMKRGTEDNKMYTFLKRGIDETHYILEYRSKKKGTLSIYIQ